MRLYLNSKCRFVKGYKNSAIYNLENGNVYSLNAEAGKIVDGLLAGDISPEENQLPFLKNLIDLNLFTYHAVPPEKDQIIPHRLEYTWLELTDACNLRCVHCYGHFGYTPTDSHLSMSLDDWKGIVDQLLKLDCKSIQLIGGEPTVFKGFADILKYAHSSGMKRIDIFTNATLLNEKIIGLIKEINASVRVSLYGHNAAVHDSITQCSGSFEKTDRALRMMQEAKVNASISVILMRENQDFIRQIQEYIVSIGYKYNGYDTIRKVEGGGQDNHLLTNIDLLQKRYQTKASFCTSEQSFAKNSQWNSCWFGKAAVTSSGNVLPCIFARDEVCGNVKATPLSEIVETALKKKWAVTKDSIDVCKDCEFRYACHDCRPLSYALSGCISSKCNPHYSKYPRCCYDPYNGEWLPVEDITREIDSSYVLSDKNNKND